MLNHSIKMRPFEDFQKNAMREAMERVYSWKQEHPDDSKQVSSEYHRCVKILALLNVLFTYYHIKKLKEGDH